MRKRIADWARCKCGHRAQDHNQPKPGPFGCDRCGCEEYVGKPIYEKKKEEK